MLINNLREAARNIKPLHDLYRLLIPIQKSPIRKKGKKEYIFVRLHKVGGTSIQNVLKIQKQHYTSKEIIAMIGRSKWDDVYKFAFVRNPFSKVVSAYNYFSRHNRYAMREKPISFEGWIKKTYGANKDPHYYFSEKWFLPQTEWLKDDADKLSLDKIGKLENIGEDFTEIASHLGVKKDLPHLNTSKKTDYRKYFNEETYEIIKNWHQEDLSCFDYTFDNG